MIKVLIHWVLSALCLLVVARLVPGFVVRSFGAAMIAAVVIGLVNATLGLLLKILTFPLTVRHPWPVPAGNQCSHAEGCRVIRTGVRSVRVLARTLRRADTERAALDRPPDLPGFKRAINPAQM